MRKMALPGPDASTTLDACVGAVADLALRTRYCAGRKAINQAYTAFDGAARSADWAGLPRAPRGNPDFLVTGGLSKGDLVRLYTDYMVGATGPSRDIYDHLLAAAGGLCPFCGGLGQASTLDHYLPKAFFPAYAVHPQNLVPCCRDCNSGRNAAFGSGLDDQMLHPYLDQARFFDERWVTAAVEGPAPLLLRYACTPPAHWSAQDMGRVRRHFAGYKLGSRFSVQAGAEASKVVQSRAGSLRKLTPKEFRDFLLENARCPDFVLNGWNRTMYEALAASPWFVRARF